MHSELDLPNGPCDTLCTGTTVFSGAAKSQDYALALLVIRRGFGFGRAALSFAQRSLLVLPSLFFLGPFARRSLSFSSVSPVIWLECHEALSCGGLISYLAAIYVPSFEFACLCCLPAQGTSRDNVKSDARLRDVAQIAGADRAHLRRCEGARQVRRFEP